MKKHLLIFIVFGISTFQVFGQNNQGTGFDQMKIQLQIWQESKPDYEKFIKKQAKTRKKLDHYIKTEDLPALQILKNAYVNEVQQMQERGKLAASLIEKDTILIITEKTFAILHDRYQHLVASQSEIILPMLMKDKELYAVAENLSTKYAIPIEKVDRKIRKKYAKFKKAERKISLKYHNFDDRRAPKKKKNKAVYESNVFTDAKILLTPSSLQID